MILSYYKLFEAGACQYQLNQFQALFGLEPVTVTVALCEQHADKFEWDWAVSQLLPSGMWEEYSKMVYPARVKYSQVLNARDGTGDALLAFWTRYRKAKARAFGLLAERVE
jgi:hypothetical protein